MLPNSDHYNFRLYRKLEQGEFLVVFGDTAQGGLDKNFTQGLSKTKMDFPIVFSMHGVAAQATPYIHQLLEWIFDQTGVQPVFAFERQNGGASEMHRLMMMNRSNKYILYRAKDEKGHPTDKLGWDTTEWSRALMLGDWKNAWDNQAVRIYDQETIEQHTTFVSNRRGKPEADSNMHDDGVLSSAGAYQLLLTENPRTKRDDSNVQTTGDTRSLIY
jgi:hypothetical protein